MHLTVAGPEPGSVVPAVLGLTVADAVARLSASGIAADVVVEAESIPEDAVARSGKVWSQQPAAGAPKPAAVQLRVNP